MKILLTGASGFVGSHLARLLADRGGEDVHVLLRPEGDRRRLSDVLPKLSVIEGNFLDEQTWAGPVRELKPDLCIHLAWITTPGVYLKSPINLDLVLSTIRLAQTLFESGCRRFVSVGTCFEYDLDASCGRPVPETAADLPKTLYAASKVALRTLFQKYSETQSWPVVWPRFFYLYGPGEHEKRLMPTLIRSHLRGEPVKLTSADKVRDYLHVSDVAAALWAVARGNLLGPVNIGSGQAVTMNDIAETISRLTGRSGLSRFGEAPDDPADPRHVVADNRKLLQTGWKPRYSLEEGLRHTIDWWKPRIDL